MRQGRGFTLIEMLIVLAMLGILGAVTALSVQNYVKTLRANETARALANYIAQARDRALERSEAMSILLSGNDVNIYDTAGHLVRQGHLPYQASATPTTTLRFGGRGLPDRQYVFEVTVGPKTRKVVVLTTGKVVLP